MANHCLLDKEEYVFDNMKNCVIDNRTFKWFAFKMGDIIDPLMEKRKELKQKKDPISFALQESIKLVINTLWGLLTSPYFDVSNGVCSEYVTSSIRSYVWMMSRALNTNLCITDGGPYSLLNVTYLKKDKLPGLNTLSSSKYYTKHRSIKMGPLGGIEWKVYFEKTISDNQSPFTNLDALALEHVERFWASYELKFEVKLEHKFKNTFLKASYFSKAHYMFQIYDDKINTYSVYYSKIRGFKKDESIKYENPIYKFLDHMIQNGINIKYIIENEGLYYQNRLICISAWKKSLITTHEKTKVSKYGKNIRPGDVVAIECNFRMNNTHFEIETLSEFQKRSQRSKSASEACTNYWLFFRHIYEYYSNIYEYYSIIYSFYKKIKAIYYGIYKV
jgi:hypothetical protein